MLSSTTLPVQLSPQVSECLALDLALLAFIRSSIERHYEGEFGQVYGPELESCQYCYLFGGRYHSVFEYGHASSSLHGQQLLIVSPRGRAATLVSFVGELF